jgi:cholesterol transport system auxiliary component
MTRAVLSLILSAMLAACAGSLFKNKIPPPTMYMLSARKAPVADAQSAAAPQAAPGSSTAADLAVLRPRVRAGLDTDRIAALYPDRRMDYFANVRWSGPLDEVLQDLAVQEIHANPGLHNVSADRSVFASAYWLEIEVTDFQAEYADSGGAPTVHVHMQARLGTSADRKVLARFEPNIYEAASDNRMSAIVEAYSRAVGKALSEIGQGSAQALAK